jgi:STAS-like domain of unknown function (DUF4325)
MTDWKQQLEGLKQEVVSHRKIVISLPPYFNFKDHDAFNFDKALRVFDWSLQSKTVEIDFSKCRSANYQALSLVVLYAWHLKSQGCRTDFTGIRNQENGRAADVWKRMGAPGLFSVAFNENQNFRSHEHKPLIAIRNHTDAKAAMAKASDFSEGFPVEYINTLRYVISELLYNTLEHGSAQFQDEQSWNTKIPSIVQFTWYQKTNQIHFLVGDLGVGIRQHLSQTYHDIEDDEAALRKAIQPQVSGTFALADPYQAKNNAGMGLYLSTNIIKKLRADMHLISGDAVLHVSPTDVTTRKLEHSWPGTIAHVALKLDLGARFEFERMMSDFRESAQREQKSKNENESQQSFYISLFNYFGKYPEDKEAAIKFRDKHFLPAIAAGKRITLDLDGVESSPHSFLNALLATPIKRMGIEAYRRIKIMHAKPDIRETIDFILEDNTSDIEPREHDT